MTTSTSVSIEGATAPPAASLTPFQIGVLTAAVVLTCAGLIYAVMFAIAHWTPMATQNGNNDLMRHVHILYIVHIVAATIALLITGWSAIACDPAQPDRMRQTWSRMGVGIAGVILVYIGLHLISGLTEKPLSQSTSFDMLKN